jgi:uncharacterized coiled-coil protein SlyX
MMPAEPEKITHALLAKLTPRIVALILMAAIVSLAGLVILAIFKGAEVDLLGFKVNARGTQPPAGVVTKVTAEDFIARLPTRVRGSPEEAKQKIDAELGASDKKSTTIATLEERVAALEQTVRRLTEEKDNLQQTVEKSRDKFLNLIQRLEDERTRWEGSINTNIRVEEKSEVFRLLQQLLQRIGYYDGPIDADPPRTREALKKYKQAKGFTDEQYWAYVTRETVIFMVSDYAQILLKESRG